MGISPISVKEGPGGMEPDNVATYQLVLEAFNREGVEGVLPYISEDVEIFDPDLPPAPYRGHDAIRRVAGQLMSGFENVEIQEFRLIPAGDRVVALLRTRGKGERIDLEVEMSDAHTVTFQDGKIVHWRLYLDQSEALADAGLDPALARADAGPSGAST
jgi:ketosteroid isomerase-like protein